MAKFLNDSVLDKALDLIATTSVVSICLSQPADFAGALGTASLGTVGAAAGNFALANGDSSGRKITYGPGTVVVGTTGTVSHVSFTIATGAGKLIAVGT